MCSKADSQMTVEKSKDKAFFSASQMSTFIDNSFPVFVTRQSGCRAESVLLYQKLTYWPNRNAPKDTPQLFPVWLVVIILERDLNLELIVLTLPTYCEIETSKQYLVLKGQHFVTFTTENEIYLIPVLLYFLPVPNGMQVAV